MVAQVLHVHHHVAVAVAKDVVLLVQEVVKDRQNHQPVQVVAIVVVEDALEVVRVAANHLVVVVVLVHQKVAIVRDAKVIVIHHVGPLAQNIVPMTAKVIARQHVHHHVIGDFVQVDVVGVVHRHVVELVHRLAQHHVLDDVILLVTEPVEAVVTLLVLVLVHIL